MDLLVASAAGGLALASFSFWLAERSRHARTRKRLEAESRTRQARLASAIIRLRHAYVSELYNSESLGSGELVREAIELSSILADCENLLETVAAGLRSGAAPDLSAHLDDIQNFVARCGSLRDSFFRDAGLFYVAGLLEYGGRLEESRFLRENLRHGTLRAKAAQASILLLTPPLPKKMRAPKGAHSSRLEG